MTPKRESRDKKCIFFTFPFHPRENQRNTKATESQTWTKRGSFIFRPQFKAVGFRLPSSGESLKVWQGRKRNVPLRLAFGTNQQLGMSHFRARKTQSGQVKKESCERKKEKKSISLPTIREQSVLFGKETRKGKPSLSCGV